MQSYGAQSGAAAAVDGGGVEATQPGATIVLASRARRWVARGIDGALFLAGCLLVLAVVLGSSGDDELTPLVVTFLLGGAAVVWLLLFPVALARFERTVGKAMLGLRVVRMRNGKRIGFWRAVWRELFYLLISLVPLLGELNVLSCLWDKPYRQCWHDKVAGTITVDQSTFTATTR